MAARQTYYQESLGESTYNTDTNYQTKVTLTFTPDANSTYLVFYSALIGHSATTNQSKCRLRNNTSGTDLNEVLRTAKDTTDYWCASGFAVQTFGASPAEQTYLLQYGTSNTGNTVAIKEAHAIAIKLGANDFSATGDGPHTVTDTNYVTGVTMTQTFTNGADYYGFACAEITTTSTAAIPDIEAQYDAATSLGRMQHDLNSTSDAIPWINIFTFTGDGTSNNLIIRCRSSSTSDVGFRKARLVVLKKVDFEAAFYAETRSRDGGTDTSYKDITTTTQTPANAEHLVFGGGIQDTGSSTSSGFMQFLEGATSLGEHVQEASTTGAAGGAMSYCMGYRKTLAASSTTWKTQRKSEAAGITTGIDEGFILILQTAVVSGDVTVNLGGVAGTGAAGASTATGTASVSTSGVSATGSPGAATVAVHETASVGGLSASGSPGAVSVTGTASVVPSGVAGTGSPGAVTTAVHETAAVSGLQATGSPGEVAVDTGAGDVSVDLAGLVATGAAGAATATGTAEVQGRGIGATGSPGAVAATGDASISVSGVQATGSPGATTATGTAQVSAGGTEATGHPGTVSIREDATVTAGGTSATGSVGTPAVTGGGVAILTGAQGAGEPGAVLVLISTNKQVYTVPAEGRTSAPSENRTGAVGAETRTSSPSESRTTGVGSETRTAGIA